MGKILVVEDDKSIQSLVKMTLEMGRHEVQTVSDGLEGVRQVKATAGTEEQFDLILLDVMLPGLDGYGVLKEVKETNIAVIFMTAKNTVPDTIFGLNLGADDYITKPFEPVELLARVESNLRMQERYRVGRNEKTENNHIVVGNIAVDIRERTVTRDGKEVSLTAKEFELLNYFLENQNIVLTREKIIDEIWGYDYYGETRTVDMHVAQLRQKLKLNDAIETVYKVGYKFRNVKDMKN